MPTYTPQQLQDRLKKLPQVLQEAMFSPDIATKMFALGKKHGLAIDKIGFAAEETGYVILGFTKPQEFTGILKARLEIDEEKTRAIASEINREIFYPLREELKQTHQIEIAEESRIKNQESRETATVPPKPEESTTAPQSAKPLEPPKPPTPKPPLPPTSAPIDLRTSPTAKSHPEKPPLSELLPKAPVPAPVPPAPPSMPPLPKLPESRSTKYEVRESSITQEAPKPAPPPKPEMMPGGGVFAAPLEAQNTKHEARGDESQSPLKPKGIEKNPPTKYDPYREPVE